MSETLLIERYRIAYAEYRAEVSLGWERQKLFLTLNPALTAFLSSTPSGLTRCVTLLATAGIALAGALIVRRSHTRYQAARGALLALEDALGFQDLQTTGGQRAARGNPHSERFRIVDVIAIVFLLLAAIDVRLAFL